MIIACLKGGDLNLYMVYWRLYFCSGPAQYRRHLRQMAGRKHPMSGIMKDRKLLKISMETAQGRRIWILHTKGILGRRILRRRALIPLKKEKC